MKTFFKKIVYVFMIMMGIFCLYAALRQIFLKNKFDLDVISVIAFGIAIISIAISSLFYEKEDMFGELAKYRVVRYLYTLGSASFSLICIINAYHRFGLNFPTFGWIFSALFFGFGCLVILFLDFGTVNSPEFHTKYLVNNDCSEEHQPKQSIFRK